MQIEIVLAFRIIHKFEGSLVRLLPTKTPNITLGNKPSCSPNLITFETERLHKVILTDFGAIFKK